jgi:hypothetical protein
MRSIEPGISRFLVWSFGPSRNDGLKWIASSLSPSLVELRTDKSLLATTAIACTHAVALRGAKRPRFCLIHSPFCEQRARGMPGANAPAAWCALSSKSMHTSRHRKSPGIPHTMVLRRLTRSPGTGLSCPLHSVTGRASLPGWARTTFTKLDISVGVSGPHALARPHQRRSSCAL